MTGEAKRDDVLGCWAILVLIGLAVGAYFFGREHGWFSHDVEAVITTKSWSVGEYKTCAETIASETENEPHLDCSDGFTDEAESKRFKVSFYGATYDTALDGKAVFIWRCMKNAGTDPSFTCDQKMIVPGSTSNAIRGEDQEERRREQEREKDRQKMMATPCSDPRERRSESGNCWCEPGFQTDPYSLRCVPITKQ